MRLLLTGADGFTGVHLTNAAKAAGYEVFALSGELQDLKNVDAQVKAISPTHTIHLAGISHVTGDDALAYYDVNLLGSLNLLQALTKLEQVPKKVILASSANVYGNNPNSPISEQAHPAPVSHYAMSKLAMEYLSQPFLSQLPIVITRPFNYTGIGHADHFVIPKIVDHFKRKAQVIELGNVTILREYNDVRDVCHMYIKLLEHGQGGKTYNLASGQEHSLREVIAILEKISEHRIQVLQNSQFVRANEIFRLTGDNASLQGCIGTINWRTLEDTLRWMLEANS
jgi:nucleoside-diphosphate-sugar epimerase